MLGIFYVLFTLNLYFINKDTIDDIIALDFGSWEIIRVGSATQKNMEGFDISCVWSNKSKLCGFYFVESAF